MFNQLQAHETPKPRLFPFHCLHVLGQVSLNWKNQTLATYQNCTRPLKSSGQDPLGHMHVEIWGGGLFVFLGPHPRQMGVPRLGVQSEL